MKVLDYVKKEILRLEDHINVAKQHAADAHALQQAPARDYIESLQRIERLENRYAALEGKFARLQERRGWFVKSRARRRLLDDILDRLDDEA